ncbi:MAG: DUF6496 domain-containing protein [Bacteriovoracia bacterium]
MAKRKPAKTDKEALRPARKDKKKGKAPSTQARHFVRKEIEHMKSKKHAVKNKKQAIAIGLSKARKRGIPVKKKTGNKKK